MSRLTDKVYWERVWEDSIFAYTANLRWLRRYLYCRIDNILKTSLAKNHYKKFFEVGCGGGKWLVYFAKHFGFQVCGIDYSESGVLSAKKVTSLAKVKAEIFYGDIFEYYTSNSKRYDVVLSDGFIEHFDDTEFVLRVLGTFVKPNGTLITIIPNISGIHNSMIKLFGHGERVFKTHKMISLKELISWHEDNHFTNVHSFVVGSIIPKNFPLPSMISKPLNAFLRALDLIDVHIEGERLSSTYLVLGEKKNCYDFSDR